MGLAIPGLDPNMIAGLLAPPAAAVVAPTLDEDEDEQVPTPPPPPMLRRRAVPEVAAQETPLPPPMLRRRPETDMVQVRMHEPAVMRALASLSLLAGGDPEALDQDVARMAERLDRDSGGPYDARYAVDQVTAEGDRLRALQARFPLAVPVEGTSNFIYIDPETNDPILFDEDGWALKDFVELVPEAAEALGMAGGAAIGSLFGPVGTVVGSGLGAATGRRFAQAVGQDVAGVEDTRTPGQQLAESGGAALTGAAFGAVGPVARAAGGRLLRAARLQPRHLSASADRVETMFRAAGGQSADDIAAAAQLAGEGPAAAAYRLATRTPAVEQPAVQLTRMRAAMDPDVWDGVAGNVWAMMSRGQGVVGANPSARVFAEGWQRMAPAVRDALFGGSRYAAVRPVMDDFARLVVGPTGSGSGSMLRNATGAAKRLISPLMGSRGGAVGGALAGLATGGVPGAIGGAVGGGILLPASKAVATAVPRVLAHQPFMTWLTQGVRILNRSPSALQALMARLGAVAAAEPGLQASLRLLYPEAFDVSQQQVR